MDFVISSPNPNAGMGNDSVEVDSTVAPPLSKTVCLEAFPSPDDAENVDHALAATSEEKIYDQHEITHPVSTSSQQPAIEVAKGSGGGGTVRDTPPTTQIPPQVAATGLQIVTRRKRFSLSAAAAAGSLASLPDSGNSGSTNAIIPSHSTHLTTAPAPPASEPDKTSQPPRKKKKYTPKPKKAAVEAKPKPEPKPKAAPKPKTPKKSAERKPPSKGKRGQQQQQLSTIDGAGVPELSIAGKEIPAETKVEVQPAPLLPMTMPKLTKMPIANPALSSSASPHVNLPLQVRIKEEPQEWEDNLNDCDTFPVGSGLIEEPQAGGKPASSSRKKKSKGRNGNIYIGVFNRIEWMKLQEEFGFQTVNNFGTFVLQTMRRVHGDIQFWCDVATTSGVYPDLSRYEWKNGFPHAVNQDGNNFTPEAVKIDEEKGAELGEMARIMWEERQELLKQQQQQQDQQQEVPVEVVTVPDDVEEVEEEDGDDHGLENYLENMANGQYFPSGVTHEGGETRSSASAAVLSQLTPEQVNRIWSKEANNPQSLQIFGNLIDFVNGIQCIQHAKEQQQPIEEEGMGRVVEGVIGINLEFDGSSPSPIHLSDVDMTEEIQAGETALYTVMQVDENTGEQASINN